MSYFTYLWKNDTWKDKAKQAAAGYDELDYAASHKFTAAGVVKGSGVFIVTVKKGELFLGGYISVAEVGDLPSAAKYLEKEEDQLWKASDYILADKAKLYRFKEDTLVDASVARALEFTTLGGGFVNLKFDSSGGLNGQTLRGVRRLYYGAEKDLFRFL